MKNFILRILFSSIFIISSTLVQADLEDKIQLSSPGKLCFPQTSLHAEWPIGENGYRLDNVMLTHYLIIPKEDHFKKGAVFVGFRLKSQPEKLWLFDGHEWKIMNDTDPQFFVARTNTIISDAREISTLQPIIHTYISDFPINVNAYTNDGELLVGHGIMNESGPAREAFIDMLQNNRFKVLWEIGSNSLNTLLETVCLNITEMTVIIPTASTANK
ncbi:MAG: hypothetical protein DYH15_13585 [Nitrosomonas sp. PRO4]|nr:hypothetical protein [Nitrosomonas sp. PRO4]